MGSAHTGARNRSGTGSMVTPVIDILGNDTIKTVKVSVK